MEEILLPMYAEAANDEVGVEIARTVRSAALSPHVNFDPCIYIYSTGQSKNNARFNKAMLASKFRNTCRVKHVLLCMYQTVVCDTPPRLIFSS